MKRDLRKSIPKGVTINKNIMQNHEQVPVGGAVILLLVILNAVVMKGALIVDEKWYLALIFTLPLLIATIFNRRFDSI